MRARRDRLTQDVYNVTSFSPSAAEILDLIRAAYPQAAVTYSPDINRQGIVDGWPEDVDDSAARRDWGWQPDYAIRRAFEEYLIPTIARRYARK